MEARGVWVVGVSVDVMQLGLGQWLRGATASCSIEGGMGGG
jgi:hypothetical protein